MRRSRSASSDDELNIVPMMNLFVVLVPMLLLSAVFVQVSTVELATAGDGVGGATEDTGPPTVTITADEFVVRAHAAASVSARLERANETALADLESALAALEPAAGGPEIIIAAAPGVQYQALISVIDRATAAAFTSYSLAGYREKSDAD